MKLAAVKTRAATITALSTAQAQNPTNIFQYAIGETKSSSIDF